MTAVASRTAPRPRYVAMFPAWEGRRPLSWFFAEQLLEARAESALPTNAAGPDEDVNMYLVGLLERWALADPRPGVVMAADPLLSLPCACLTPTNRAAWHRHQADHRLLALGLFDRGDLVRRHRVGWRMTEAETRQRDLTVMLRSYELAAAALAPRQEHAGLVAVWRKLAVHGEDYVNALQTLARRRLGLGARLRQADLERLMAGVG